MTMDKPSEVLKKMLGSEARTELLVLFHKNPGLFDSLDGVANRIGREPSSMEGDLRELVALGMVKSMKIGSKEVFTLDDTRDWEIQEVVGQYISQSRSSQ